MKKWLGIFLAGALLAPIAWAADDLLSSQMVDEARAWTKKGRDDLAAEVWRKLLRTNSRHPEALVKLGLIEARVGNIKEAQALQLRAGQLAQPPQGLKELSTLVKATEYSAKGSVPPVSPAPVRVTETAPKTKEVTSEPLRRVAQPKEAKSAPAATSTVSDLAVYQTQSAFTEKWEDTRRSLEQLVQYHPTAPRYRIALASHLTHRESTRREAIRQLEALTLGDRDGKRTKIIWQQALLALSARESDRELFSAYLARFPRDTLISERVRGL